MIVRHKIIIKWQILLHLQWCFVRELINKWCLCAWWQTMASELNAEESAASLLDRVNVVENAEEYQRYLVWIIFVLNHWSSRTCICPNLFQVIHIFCFCSILGGQIFIGVVTLQFKAKKVQMYWRLESFSHVYGLQQ